MSWDILVMLMQLELFAGFKSPLRSEVWRSYNFLDVPLV